MASLDEVVSRDAHNWGAAVKESYHDRAESAMNSQWDRLILPTLSSYSIDKSVCMDLAAGFGRNTSKMLGWGAAEVIAVDVNPECISRLRDRFRTDKRVRVVQNDGFCLSAINQGEISFLYCFDAMVHFDISIIQAYVGELTRVMRDGAFAFIHHSNYSANPGGNFKSNPHWRNFMTAGLFRHLAICSGLAVREQRLIDWGGWPALDCLTVLQRPER